MANSRESTVWGPRPAAAFKAARPVPPAVPVSLSISATSAKACSMASRAAPVARPRTSISIGWPNAFEAIRRGRTDGGEAGGACAPSAPQKRASSQGIMPVMIATTGGPDGR